MSGLIDTSKETELGRYQFIHPSDHFLSTVLVYIPKCEYGEFVVWDVNTTHGRGGRSNGAYFIPEHFTPFPANKQAYDRLPQEEQQKLFQAAKKAAYAEFHRRLSRDMKRNSVEFKGV